MSQILRKCDCDKCGCIRVNSDWSDSLHFTYCQHKSEVELVINDYFVSFRSFCKVITPSTCDSFNYYAGGAVVHRTIISNTYTPLKQLMYAQNAFCNCNIKALGGYNDIERCS